MSNTYLLTYLIVFLFLFQSALTGQEILRGPYLQFSTTEGVIIRWRTDIATDSKIWYGDDYNSLSIEVTSGELTTEHEIQLSGLEANTLYYYAVGNSSALLAGESENHYFKTNPLPDTDQAINIWVLGDAGSREEPQRTVRDAYYAYNGNDPIDMMLLLGDNAYDDGTDEEFQDAWFENMYEDRLINSVMWSCYGNHEAHSSNSVDQTGPYYDIYNFPTNGENGGAPSGTESYFSFDYANVHVISLNAFDEDRSTEGPMLTWLEQDLLATDKDWIIALMHYPPYSGADGNNSDTNSKERDMRENALPILEAAGADLVLYGHAHVYQRSFLINGHYDISATFNPELMALDIGDGKIDGDAAYVKAIGGPNDGKGTIYMNTGSAGKLSENILLDHPVMYHNNSAVHGSVSIKVNGNQMDVYFIDETETIDDYFSIVKLPEPPEVNIMAPANGTYYQNIETVEIMVDASDSNGNVDKIDFYIDNVLIGSDYNSPYAINWTPSELGSYRIKTMATDNDGNSKSAVSVIQVGPVSLCAELLKNSDDSEESELGVVSIGSSDLELAYDEDFQTIGLRFSNMDIPKNAIINNAYLQFTAKDAANINPCEINIYAEDNDESESFLGEDFNISTRPKTESVVVWTPSDWENAGDSGPAQQTVDISEVIQEVVFRPGYSEKSSISLLMDGIGQRRAISRNDDPNKAVELCLEYNPVCPDSDFDGVCDAIDLCPNGLEPGTLCDDEDPDTFDDVINDNCVCLGDTFDCPQFAAYFGDSCDDNNPNTYNDILDNNCDCLGIVATMNYVCSQINTSSDDAEENENGTVYLTSGDLEMVEESSNQSIGLRFTGLNLPFGAIIHYASIQFTADQIDNINPCELNIFGEANANPITFRDSLFDISNRPRTVANVSWAPPNWDKLGQAGREEMTADISPVIQEIVHRIGFDESSPLVLLIDGIGKRTAKSFDGYEEAAPTLCIDYYIDGPPGGFGSSTVPPTDKEESTTATNNTVITEFTLYPNPVTEQLHILYMAHQQEENDLFIRDVSGRIVFSKKIATRNGSNHVTISDLGLPGGIYVVQLFANSRWHSERVCIRN